MAGKLNLDKLDLQIIHYIMQRYHMPTWVRNYLSQAVPYMSVSKSFRKPEWLKVQD